MHELLHILEHAAEDTWGLVPFLFVTYLALEALEHAAGDRVNRAVRRAGAAGPVVGALLGMVPQCGFSAMGATLYAGRVITLGTLVAVFMSTSDEMLPLLVADQVPLGDMAGILGAKAILALVSGVAIDMIVRLLKREHRHRPEDPAHLIDEVAEAGEGTSHIHRLCERDHCGCEEDENLVQEAPEHLERHAHGGHRDSKASGGVDVVESQASGCGCSHSHAAHDGAHHAHAHGLPLWSIVRSALIHTVQVTVFIFLITFVLVAVLETVGESALEQLLSSNAALTVFASALVGLVPNCAASVVITQLYLEGVLGFAPMIAGTLASAGVGYLVLFRTNRGVRQNLLILALIFGASVVWGMVFSLLGI